MKSIFIFGLSGRMGQQIQELIKDSKEFQLVGGYSKDNSGLDIKDDIDIVIDFSLPETHKDLIPFCLKKKCALVSGTTGLSPEDQKNMETLAQTLPVFWAANMSFGVYLMSQLIQELSKHTEGYDYQIIDTHHIHKKDAPSGTALYLESSVNSQAQLKPTKSLREGEVLGIHNFKATAPFETLEIIHTAKDRKLFADGALRVALWLSGQTPGFYSMADYFRRG